MGWIGAGFLASGAAATDDVVEEAALPFDERRHGMIIGMGAAGLMVESAAAARERGLTPICEVLGSVTANSAFHGTRLDVEHISGVMEQLVEQAEGRGLRREDIAGETVFVSHETYTPARGGSAAAEIHALRDVFGEDADRIVIANVKGFTGHPDGRRPGGRAGREGAGDRRRSTGAQLPRSRPRAGRSSTSRGAARTRSATRFGWRPASARRSRCCSCAGRRSPTAAGATPTSSATTTGSPIAPPGPHGCRRVSGYEEPQLEVVQHRLRVVDQGPPPARGWRPHPRRIPRRRRSSPGGSGAGRSPAAASEPAPAAPPRAGRRRGAGAGDRRRADGLSDGSARHGARPRGRSGDRHGQAGRGVRAIREAYGIERDDSLKLRDYPTLNHVVGFVSERSGARGRRGAAARAGRAAPRRPSPPLPPRTRTTSTERVLAVVAEQTGYPTDLLDMDLDLEADLGIDTVKQAEVFASIRETYGIERDDTLKLRDYPTLNHVVGFVSERSGAAAAGAAPRRRPLPASRRCRRRPPSPLRAPAAPAPATARGAGAGDRRRADRLPDRAARHGPRPRGRPGDRHGQAGRGVRRDPRDLRDRASTTR